MGELCNAASKVNRFCRPRFDVQARWVWCGLEVVRCGRQTPEATAAQGPAFVGKDGQEPWTDVAELGPQRPYRSPRLECSVLDGVLCRLPLSQHGEGELVRRQQKRCQQVFEGAPIPCAGGVEDGSRVGRRRAEGHLQRMTPAGGILCRRSGPGLDWAQTALVARNEFGHDCCGRLSLRRERDALPGPQ
jgi:hypothetical protein